MIRFTFCLAVVLGVCLMPVRGQVAVITIDPDTTVQVGQEVYFYAGGAPGNTDVVQDTFMWDFGDGYCLKWEEPASMSYRSGLSCSHYYMLPGTYTVTLWVHQSTGGIDSTTRTLTVTGMPVKCGPRVADDPILELNFESSLADSSPNGLTAMLSTGTPSYVPGREGMALDISGDKVVRVMDPDGKLGGLDEFTISMWLKQNPGSSLTGSTRLFEKNGAYYYKLESGYRPRISMHTGSWTEGAFDSFGEIAGSHYWTQVAVTYDGDTLRAYVDRIPFFCGPAGGKGLTGTITRNTSFLILGGGVIDESWDGLIDEVKVYDRALSGDEIFDEFEIKHGPFQARVDQYLRVLTPAEVRKDAANRLYLSLTGNNGYSEVLINKAAPEAVEKVLLNNGALEAGIYTLTAELRSGNGTVQERIAETFDKPYDGIPRTGINRYNALCKNGKPFYFIRALGINERWVSWWAKGDYVNSFISEGFSEAHTVESYRKHLDRGTEVDAVYIGPGNLPPGQTMVTGYHRNLDPELMRPFFDAFKDHPAQLGWFWRDEPNLGGDKEVVPPEVCRAWVNRSNTHCPQQTGSITYAGAGFYRDPADGSDRYHITRLRNYTKKYNESRFGGKSVHVSDIVAWDAYPTEQGDQAAGGHIFTQWATAMDRSLHDTEYDVPVLNCIETQRIRNDRLPGPVADELRMMSWLNVVHGMKGANFFHYFNPIPAQNLAVEREFKQQVETVDTLVLGPPSDVVVTDDANTLGNRVDIMVREDANHLWIFAVRLTERNGVDDDTIDVTFTLPGSYEGKQVVMPSHFTQSKHEYLAAASHNQREFTFTLNEGNPILPGTIHLMGGDQEVRLSARNWVWDDGTGTLFTYLEHNVRDTCGTVDYATGSISVNFTGSNGQNDIPVSDSSVVASYAPDNGDRQVAGIVDGSFGDSFEPWGVRVYRIEKPAEGIDTRGAGRTLPVYRVLFPNPSFARFQVQGMRNGEVYLSDLGGGTRRRLPVAEGMVNWKKECPDLDTGVYLVSDRAGTVLGRVMLMNR